MAFTTVAGGFELTQKDREVLLNQRAITKQINARYIQVGAIFLKMSSKNPYDDDWFKKNYRDVDLQSWIDDEALRYHNVGFNLQLGWMDIDIDAQDPEYNRCVLAALDYLQVDTRFRFGRLSAGVASHVLVQLDETESSNFAALSRFEPREFRIDGKRYHTQLRSFPTNVKAENLAKSAKQTVMPGSIYSHKVEADRYDMSVWFCGNQVAEDAGKVAATTPRRTSFMAVVQAIAFGTMAYCMRDVWVEGNRQFAAQKVGGWLARVIRDSSAMNTHEVVSKDVYCPVDSESVAESLLGFICEMYDDDEKHMRIRAFHDAVEKLERNPDAKIPGWPAMEMLVGPGNVMAMRAVLMPGSDVTALTELVERYVYDESDGTYIDRKRFFTMGNWKHEAGDLMRRHKSDVIHVGKKPVEAFYAFESSAMRVRVGMCDLWPNLNPGSIYRISAIGEVLSDDDELDNTSLTVFNTWKGWPVRPTDYLDEALMADLIARLDVVLGYLTQDKAEQIHWIKQWIAWTIQHPGDKQQIAWVVVGEQGIGKSWIGNIFLQALMGSLWGSASPKVMEGDFVVGPFIDKMLVFIDEAKFHSEIGVDEIKKVIRSTDVPGAEKFKDARNYRLFARLMFASNRMDINIGQANVQDRALFYTRAYDREFKGLTEQQFRAWAETLKPWFDEFTQLMKQRKVREHFMHYFINYPTTRGEVESNKHSSSNDPVIISANMTWARRVAKYIVEDGRILEDLDITYPFTMAELSERVARVAQDMGLRNVQTTRVYAEFEQAGVVERVVCGSMRKIRFTHKIGDLLRLFGEAIACPLEQRFVLDPEKDYGPNACDGSTRPAWKGSRPGVVQGAKF